MFLGYNFRIMMKRLVLIVVLGGVFSMHEWAQELPLKNQENSQSGGQQGKPADANNQSSFGKILEEREGKIRDYFSKDGQKDTAEHPLDYAKLGFGVSVFVALITLLIAVASFIQASAAWLAASAVMHSERAWVVPNIPFGPRNPAIPRAQGSLPVVVMCALKNKGKTPAFVLEAGQAIAITNDSEELPKTPPPYDPERVMKWRGRGIPISPKSAFARYALISEVQDPINIYSGSTVLWVYGYVKYRDVFSLRSVFRRRIHETRFCFRFLPGNPDVGIRPSFVLEGPDAYNRAT